MFKRAIGKSICLGYIKKIDPDVFEKYGGKIGKRLAEFILSDAERVARTFVEIKLCLDNLNKIWR
tara:strand:+ start:832 stop:1026 length:195 start_codon:yes stop_codon:yes gene_type:complete